MFEDEKSPTSKEEAAARRMRPPPEKYDPDKRSRWSITMTAAWIIWRDLDAVRNECDDYREECTDWRFKRTLAERLAEKIAINERTGLARSNPALQKKLEEKLEELEKLDKEPSWHPRQWEPSRWSRLRLGAISESLLEPRQQAILPPQDAIDELWQTAENDGIKATALEFKNAKALLGDPIEIPAHHWPYLKCTDDPLTGKAMLSGPDGRVYREVQFSRLRVKELWPREGEGVHGAGAWITAEARRMKAANEILPDIRISDFARELEGRMKSATTNKSLRPIKWRSIKNKLREWGLWPVTSIK
jgi:hypothetical protein